MSKEKQIEEMAEVLENAKIDAHATIGSMNRGFGVWYANALYTAGYRKQGDGEWNAKETMIRTPSANNYICSVCGCESAKTTPFCPQCGAKMKGGEK